jgi:hypothetical protein
MMFSVLKPLLRQDHPFSVGSDSRLRLWDIDSGYNTLVNYEAMRLQTSKPLQLAVTDDPSLIFVPCMASIKVCCCFANLLVSTPVGVNLSFTIHSCVHLGIQFMVWHNISNIPGALRTRELLLL